MYLYVNSIPLSLVTRCAGKQPRQIPALVLKCTCTSINLYYLPNICFTFVSVVSKVISYIKCIISKVRKIVKVVENKKLKQKLDSINQNLQCVSQAQETEEVLDVMERVAHPLLVVGSSFGLLVFLFIKKALPQPVALVCSPFSSVTITLYTILLLCFV